MRRLARNLARNTSGTIKITVLGAFALVVFALGISGALAVGEVQHGIGLTKGCASPTKIGDPYTCSYTVRNILDEAHDTLTVNALVDVVHAASGDTSSGNVIGSVQITTTTTATGAIPSGATCVASSGTGVFPTPYTGVTSCTLPFGSRINVLSFSHYTVQALDFTLPSHQLRDDVNVTWHDQCNDPAGTGNRNCDPNPPAVSASSLTLVQQLPSSTATDIHNSAHAVVTTVAAGTTVHDFVTVTSPGNPPPTGNVNIDWFLNGTCTGAPATNSGSIGPLAGGQFDATGFAFTVNSAGFRAFKAHYEGNATYVPSDGPCEPLRVVDANIQITPNGVNRVGQTHTFTAHVNVNDGTGSVPAPDGTLISFTIDSGPGSFTSANPCTTAGGTGSCTIDLSSAVTGVTTVSAHANVTVAGIGLTRDTNGVGANSGPATKTWVNAKIAITPDATNEVGQPHTFTVTLMKDTGTGTFVAAAGEHVDVTLTNSDGATHTAPTGTCTNAGANTDANGQCTITFSSPTGGKVTGHATSTLSVAGSAPFTVATDGVAPNSGDAVKKFVDANIQITPNGVNRVGQTHTFTAHVNVDAGNGLGFQNAPDGTQISFTIGSGPGAFTSANPCTVAGGTGSCTIDLSSAVTGVTTVSAHTTLSVGGLTLTRNTDGVGANSGPATKTWVNAKIAITPDATNEVGQPHTFTVTLQKDPGTGLFVPAAGEHVAFTLTDSNGAVSVLNAAASTCDEAGANTNAAGQCTIVINSSSAGKVTAHASSTLSVAGSAAFTIETDGIAPNSGDAVKTYVDANIQITPNGVNRVGQTHTFTAHVNVNDGTGFVNAPPGTQIGFRISSGPGSFTTANPCTVAAGGSCTIGLSSSVTGVTTVRARVDLSVGGVSLTRVTDGTGANSGPATKTWVNAKIAITPDATNEVGQPHTFTVTLMKDTGTGTFVAAAGEHVDVTLTNSDGATHTAPTGTCTNAGANTDANGQCTITFSSPTGGKVTGHATSTLSVAGSAPFTVATDGVAPNSGDAVKKFVDANIQITPNGTNRIGSPHTFTAHVNVDAGNGLGFQNAPDGTVITFTIDSDTASSLPNPPTQCSTAGGTGSCQTTISSATTGVTTVSAHTTLSVGGLSVTRSTNSVGANSGPATKTWVNAKIAITPDATNQVGQPHTFNVTLMKDNGDGTGFHAAPGEHVDVTLTPSLGATIGAPTGTCTNAGANTDANGICTITFSSNDTGKVNGHATSTLSVGGSAPFTVETDGLILNSGDAVKTYVDARISIAPDATNEVGQPHTFTVTLQKDVGDGTGFHAAAGEHVDVTLTDSNGAVHSAPTGTCTNAGANTNASGQCTITFTSNSAGKVTGHASSTLILGPPPPATVHVETDGTGFNSGDAVKTFVDANIQITPQTATNPVGSNHILTGHVNVDDGQGGGFGNAPAGTTIVFSLQNAAGATAAFVGPNTCTTIGVTGSCQVTISSPTAGQTTIKATTDVVVGGLTLHRETGDGHPGDSPNAVKNWAGAKISITPDATNEVGQPHTFTVTLMKDTGGGFVAAAGEHVNVTLTDSNGAAHTAPTGTCTNAGANTNAAGQCTITFTSPTGGKVTGHATSTLDFGGGVMITVATDGVAPNSGDAVKTFVDANIQITPDGTNRVGQTHTFTGHVNIDSGDGLGLHNAPAGTPISFTIDSGPGAFTSANPCLTVGTTGSCTIDLSSAVTGVTTVSAHWTGTLAGLSVTRNTNGAGANSGPAVKTWVNAKITITPDATNEVGQPHTFIVTLSKDTGSGSFVAAAGEHVDVTLTDSNGAVHTAPTGTCTNAGPNTNASGQCTITFTSPTAGTVTGHAFSTLSVGGVSITVATDGVAPNSGDAVKTFVDANIQITPNGTNPVGATHVFTAHVNVNNGSGAFANAPNGTQISFTIDSGPGVFTTTNPCTTAGGTGSCQISLLSNVTGTTVVSAHSTLSVGGVSLTRHTNGSGNNSGPATKLWADASVRTDVHDSAHNVITTTTSGTSVHDKAFVTRVAGTPAAVPNPTGNVTFHRYAVIDCTGPAVDETVAIAADGTAESSSFTATASMSYQADYLGNANYPARSGACEPLNVVTLTPTVATDIHAGPGANDTAGASPITNAQPGDTVHDKATVTGSGATPTGTVTFTVYLGNQSCNATGTPGTVVNAGTVTLVNGVAHPSSNATVPDGGLSYKAHYNGDGTYTQADGPCEPLTTVLPCPAGGFTGTLNSANGDFTIVYDQFPAPNDNSYGVNAVGWGDKGHTFGNLTGSDKSGYEVVNPSGTVVLDFYIDYISATTPSATFPSGYRSLGPFGGDGAVNVGTLTTNDLTWDTSEARNLNNLGYFSLVGTTPTQSAATLSGTNGTNLLVNSPATLNTTDSYTLKTPNPWTGTTTYTENGRTINGWDFHDTFFVTLKQSKLAAIGAIEFVGGQWQLKAGWKIQPDLTGLHNSPAKPCPTTPGANLTVTKREIKDKQVKITIANSNATVDEILTQLRLTWPQATNGNLLQIKLDGDVLWTGSVGGGTTDSLGNPVGVPPLVADPNKRKINHNSSDVLAFIFANNVAPLSNAAYSGTAYFGAFTLSLGLPTP